MLFKLSWRNIWRNKRRTIITMLAIAVGVAMEIGTWGLVDGIFIQMEETLTNGNMGHFQIHRAGYLKDPSIFNSFELTPQVKQSVESNEFISAYSFRSFGYALASVLEKSAGVEIIGIDPEKENSITGLKKKIVRGNYLTHPKEVVIGNALATDLNATIGSELVVMSQATDGSIANDIFHVVGIFNMGLDQGDRMRVYMDTKDFGELFVMPGRIHEIAGRATDVTLVDSCVNRQKQLLSPTDYDIQSWHEISPTLYQMLKSSEASSYIMVLIIFLVVATLILNTMMMSIFERQKEIGVMMSIGVRRYKLISMIVVEGFWLVVISTVAGLGIGLYLDYLLIHYGWDLRWIASSDIEMMGVSLEPVFYGKIDVTHIAASCVMMIGMTVTLCFYPAFRMIKKTPVEALHRS